MLKKFIRACDEYTTDEKSIPAPYVRRGFSLDFVPEKADLKIATPGFYELYVNGKNITKGHLAPYISNPNYMVCYDVYDLAPYLKRGKNAIGIILGNGFANQTIEKWYFSESSFRAPLCVAAELSVSGEGKSLFFCADESFKVHPSPIVFDMYRYGTYYDARLAIDGWSDGDFDDSDWDFAKPADAPRGEITPCVASPIRTRCELKPVRIEKQENFCYYKSSYYGEDREFSRVKTGYLYDFGINTSGVCRIKIKGERGQKIIIRHGERLAPDGKFNVNTVILPEDNDLLFEKTSQMLQRDEYILRGGEEEIFTPPFTYHGFRFALVEGITDKQATDDLLTFVVFSSDTKKRADFRCSDETLNTLYNMSINADLSNFHYFLTDCPHREKNGWTGDSAVSAEQIFLNFDIGRDFNLWLRHMGQLQTKEGALPAIVPTEKYGFEWGNGPMWDSAAIALPFAAYKYDGRLDVFEDSADMLIKYLRYIETRRDSDGLIACGLGDWCQPGKAAGVPIKAPLSLTDTLTIYDMAKKCSILFDKVGRSDDAEYAGSLADSLYKTIRENLIDYGTMTAAGNCQTSQCYMLSLGLFTEEEYPKAYSKLIEIIERDGRKLDTGMIGLRHIFEVLCLGGDVDLAISLIVREEDPSYGGMIKRGATALCEALENGTPNASENHHFFGDIIRIFINYIVGLRPNPKLSDTKEILFCPVIPSDMDFSEAEFNGVKAGWKRDGEKIRFFAFIPEGYHGSFLYKDKKLPLNTGEFETVI